MFYEERVMDGKLWCRNTPDGQWRQVAPEVILGRMLFAERNLQRMNEQPAALQRR